MPARTYFIRLLLACAQSFDELLIGHYSEEIWDRIHERALAVGF